MTTETREYVRDKSRQREGRHAITGLVLGPLMMICGIAALVALWAPHT